MLSMGRHNYLIPDIGNFYDSFSMIFETHESTFGLLITITPFFTIIPTIIYYQRVLCLQEKGGKVAESIDPMKANLSVCFLVGIYINMQVYFIFSPHPTAVDYLITSLSVVSMHQLLSISNFTLVCLVIYADVLRSLCHSVLVPNEENDSKSRSADLWKRV